MQRSGRLDREKLAMTNFSRDTTGYSAGTRTLDGSDWTKDTLNMTKKKSKPAKPPKEYPLVTHGSQVAARGRQKANKMTDAQRKEYFRRGMVLIYGSGLIRTVASSTTL